MEAVINPIPETLFTNCIIERVIARATIARRIKIEKNGRPRDFQAWIILEQGSKHKTSKI